MRIGIAAVVMGVALVVGAARGEGEQTPKPPDLDKTGFAGPGYIQKDFLEKLKAELVKVFGEKKAEKLLETLKHKSLPPDDVVKLMNGEMSKSQVEDAFGASRADAEGCEKAVDEAVDEKDRRMFFGILMMLMVGDMDADPTSDLCQQVAGARDQASDEDLDKVLKGNVSKDLIEEVFQLTNKSDQEFMQKVLNQMKSSPLTSHPMAKSLGMGKTRSYDKSKFPPLEEGMAGCGGEFAGGDAGGMPFPDELPPCPYMGENMGDTFESCKKQEPADGGGDEK